MATSTKKKESAAAPEAAETAKRTPAKSLRVDDCSASIWAREYPVQGKPTTFYSVTFERSYKDRNGSWSYTKSFSQDDLGKLIALCQQAEAAIAELRDAAQ